MMMREGWRRIDRLAASQHFNDELIKPVLQLLCPFSPDSWKVLMGA